MLVKSSHDSLAWTLGWTGKSRFSVAIRFLRLTINILNKCRIWCSHSNLSFNRSVVGCCCLHSMFLQNVIQSLLIHSFYKVYNQGIRIYLAWWIGYNINSVLIPFCRIHLGERKHGLKNFRGKHRRTSLLHLRAIKQIWQIKGWWNMMKLEVMLTRMAFSSWRPLRRQLWMSMIFSWLLVRLKLVWNNVLFILSYFLTLIFFLNLGGNLHCNNLVVIFY